MLNWDDLRIIAAVKDAGTFAGAGARLRLDETTVARRLERVQSGLGLRLFEAVEGARRPTAQGDAVLAHIQAIAGHAAEIARVGERAPHPVGRFRIAATSAVAEEILAPRIGALLGRNPGLALVLATSGENVNFANWDADFAVRLRRPERGNFAVTRLAQLRLMLAEPAGPPLEGPIVCAYPAGLDLTPESQFLKAKGLQGAARCVSDNLRVIRTLVREGRAIGILPEFLCGDMLTDRRLRLTPLPKRRDAWLLIQHHLRRDPAARLVLDWLRACFAAWRE